MDVAAARSSFTLEKIRCIVNFHLLLNKTPTEIHRTISEALQEYAPSYEKVRTWGKSFSNGLTEVTDSIRTGRPTCSTDEGIVARVRDSGRSASHLRTDRRNVGHLPQHRLPHSADQLRKKKIAAKWVPHVLTDDQRRERVQLSTEHLHRVNTEGEAILGRIVAGDEHGYTPMNQNSSVRVQRWFSPASESNSQAGCTENYAYHFL